MALGVGSRIANRYRIASQLARGGMGVVYEAIDERLDRVVAVKVLLRELSDDRSLAARFEREARSAASLQHPGIVHVSDFGVSEEGELYLVMERVVGRTLAQVLQTEGKMSPARAADVVEQALSALAVAHRAGIVHRDLKPANLMLVSMGVGPRELVKVLDFGIAQLEPGRGAARLTRQGEVLGTPSFMAPEQAKGESLDARADIYAMGVILFCLLTGRPPFVGRDAAEVIRRVVVDVAPRADAIAREVPAELASIAEMAMSRDREKRFASADAFARSLSEWRDRAGRPSGAPALSVPPRTPAPKLAVSPRPSLEPRASAAPRGPAVPIEPRAKVGLARILVPVALVLALAAVALLALGLGAAWIVPRLLASAPAVTNPTVANHPGMVPVPPRSGDVCDDAADCCVQLLEAVSPGNADTSDCAAFRDFPQYGAASIDGCRQALVAYRDSLAQLGHDPDLCAAP